MATEVEQLRHAVGLLQRNNALLLRAVNQFIGDMSTSCIDPGDGTCTTRSSMLGVVMCQAAATVATHVVPLPRVPGS